MSTPADDVDEEALATPSRWDVPRLRDFMLVVGPVSSAFDFVTFAVLHRVFHADPALFHTGWFVESLATQTLVLFVIRTARSPFASRPSRALVATMAVALAVGVALPYLPYASMLGFVPLPASYLAFVVGATAAYLVAVEAAKRALAAVATARRARRRKHRAPNTRAAVQGAE